MSERPNWRHLDWRIIAVLAALLLLSLLFLSSAGYDPVTGDYVAWWKKQAEVRKRTFQDLRTELIQAGQVFS